MSNRTNRFTALLDANVLVGALPRNIILSLAEAGFFRPRWSTTILDEFERTFGKRFDDEAAGQRQRRRIESAFPEAMVTSFEMLIEGLALPDADDRHVLAAAIHIKAAVIVTENLRDFPQCSVVKFDIEVLSTDDFIADIIDLGGAEAVAALRKMRERFQRPDISSSDLILKIEKHGLLQTADLLVDYKDLL